MAKKVKLTVADIVSPGEILALANSILAKSSTLDSLVVVSIDKKGFLSCEYGGDIDIYAVAGILQAAGILILEAEDSANE